MLQDVTLPFRGLGRSLNFRGETKRVTRSFEVAKRSRVIRGQPLRGHSGHLGALYSITLPILLKRPQWDKESLGGAVDCQILIKETVKYDKLPREMIFCATLHYFVKLNVILHHLSLLYASEHAQSHVKNFKL